jgi:hypothetical protein
MNESELNESELHESELNESELNELELRGWKPVVSGVEDNWMLTATFAEDFRRDGFEIVDSPSFENDGNIVHVKTYPVTCEIAAIPPMEAVKSPKIYVEVRNYCRFKGITHVYQVVIRREVIRGLVSPSLYVYVRGRRVVPDDQPASTTSRNREKVGDARLGFYPYFMDGQLKWHPEPRIAADLLYTEMEGKLDAKSSKFVIYAVYEGEKMTHRVGKTHVIDIRDRTVRFFSWLANRAMPSYSDYLYVTGLSIAMRATSDREAAVSALIRSCQTQLEEAFTRLSRMRETNPRWEMVFQEEGTTPDNPDYTPVVAGTMTVLPDNTLAYLFDAGEPHPGDPRLSTKKH